MDIKMLRILLIEKTELRIRKSKIVTGRKDRKTMKGERAR